MSAFTDFATLRKKKNKPKAKKKTTAKRVYKYRPKPEKLERGDRVYFRADVTDEALMRVCLENNPTHSGVPTPPEVIAALRKMPMYVTDNSGEVRCVTIGFWDGMLPRKMITKNADGFVIKAGEMPDTRDYLEMMGEYNA